MPSPYALNQVLTRRMPEQFGRYTLLGRIATGGMAEVYVARCGELMGMQALIAVKRILPTHAADDKFVQMFQREASIALRLSHRSIARVFEVGKVGNDWFLSIELVQGENLARVTDALTERGLRWDPNLIAFIGAEIAQALHYAHSLSDARARPLKIVHRDVSPENIMIGYDGSVKIIDFGIAMCESYASLTTQGAVRGKIQYVSPEQAQTHKLDGRSDVFSLGVVLYECLAGTQPFERTSPMETLDAVVNSNVAPMPHVAPAINEAIFRALEKNPEERFHDAGEFGNALFTAVAGHDAGANKISQLVSSLFPKRLARWHEIQNMAVEGYGFADKNTRDLATQTPPPVTDPPPEPESDASESQTRLEKYYVVGDQTEPVPMPPQARPRPKRYALVGAAVAIALAGTGFYFFGRGGPVPPAAIAPENSAVRPSVREESQIAEPATPTTAPSVAPAADPPAAPATGGDVPPSAPVPEAAPPADGRPPAVANPEPTIAKRIDKKTAKQRSTNAARRKAAAKTAAKRKRAAVKNIGG